MSSSLGRLLLRVIRLRPWKSRMSAEREVTALLHVLRVPLRDIARAAGTSYGTLRVWRTQKPFIQRVTDIRFEVAVRLVTIYEKDRNDEQAERDLRHHLLFFHPLVLFNFLLLLEGRAKRRRRGEERAHDQVFLASLKLDLMPTVGSRAQRRKAWRMIYETVLVERLSTLKALRNIFEDARARGDWRVAQDAFRCVWSVARNCFKGHRQALRPLAPLPRVRIAKLIPQLLAAGSRAPKTRRRRSDTKYDTS